MTRRPLHSLLVLSLAFAGSALGLGHAAGQVSASAPIPGVEGEAVEGDTGLELALYGELAVRPGRDLVLSGSAFETRGFGTLRRVSGLRVSAEIFVRTSESELLFRPLTAASVSVAAGADGRFELAVPVPRALGPDPHVVVRIERPNGSSRGFGYALSTLRPWSVLLRADRHRYEPGETVHAWMRVLDAESGAPVAREALTVTIASSSGLVIASSEIVTGDSGSVTLDAPLDLSASGTYRVGVRRQGAGDDDPMLATTDFVVETRRTARILSEARLARAWAMPGESIGGTVSVTTPSHAPLARAAIEVRVQGEVVASGQTDEAGAFAFSVQAPTFLDVETRTETVAVRVVHALGSAELSETYVLSQAPWQIELTPEAGVLGVGIRSRLIVAVTDPVGEPIARGVEIEVTGPGLLGGRAITTTDAHGLAFVSPTVDASSVARAVGGTCSGEVAANYLAEVHTTPPIEAGACVRASRRAELAIALASPAAAPGTNLDVSVTRRPGLEALPVLLELVDTERTYAHALVAGRATRGTLSVPAFVRGVVSVRARLLHPDAATAPLNVESETGSGEEALAQVVVRPTDSFALTATPDPSLVRVRETSNVALTASPAPGRAWAALLLRDEAQHDGERDFAYETLTESLRNAVRGALAPGDELLVRLALAAPAPDPVHGAPPVLLEAWTAEPDEVFGVGGSATVSDPIAMRETLRRVTAPTWMRALLDLVMTLDERPPEVRDALVVSRAGRRVFGPRALEIATALRHGPTAEPPRAVGGLALDPDMLTEIDPSFSFDQVARLVARWRLVRLLSRLHELTSTSDEAAMRAIDGQPVSRWLAILVERGAIHATDLRDPWGWPFTMTCASGHSAHMLFSSVAADCDLASPGPDGLAGTGDDVSDPFARVVPTGTLFAIASGEDSLMERLSRIAPGATALAQMAAAYSERTLAELDETIAAALFAHPSEAVIDDFSALFGDYESRAMSGFGAIGHGSGTGSGYGYGSGSGSLRGRTGSAVTVRVALSSAIREDLPATLFFVGEVPLDATGHAVVPVRAADAMSSYHVEAVAWSESGWTTSARSRLVVDQDVEIDAPLPEVLHVGDEVRFTLRLRSRALDDLRVIVSVETEGPIAMTSPGAMDLPAGGIAVANVTLRASDVGSGRVLLRAALEDGSPLDAIRRQLDVWDDARTAGRRVRALVVDAGTLELEVPAEAMARGAAVVRVAGTNELFSISDYTAWPYGEWAEWMRGARSTNDNPGTEPSDAVYLAFATGARWNREDSDDTASAALRALTAAATGVATVSDGSGSWSDRVGSTALPEPASASWILLGLAPALRSSARPALREDLDAVASLLRELAAAEGARATDAPETWARVAAALAITGDAEDAARTTEMLRRLQARIVRVRDLGWVEPTLDDGSVEPRIEPTALVALALIHSGRASEALPFATALVDVAGGIAGWNGRAAALARLAALSLVPSSPANAVVTVDGQPVELTGASLPTATLAAIALPGVHLLSLTSPGLSVIEAEATFGLPWTAVPARPPRVEVEVRGEVGARDTRSAIMVVVRNAGARALRTPTIRILLPSGAELEEAERTRIARITGRTPRVDRDELVVTSRPLLPGRTLRIPVRVRWSLAGSLRGLGVTVTDASIPADPDAAFALPSRLVEIADEGPEPELDDSVDSGAEEVPRARDLVVRALAQLR